MDKMKQGENVPLDENKYKFSVLSPLAMGLGLFILYEMKQSTDGHKKIQAILAEGIEAGKKQSFIKLEQRGKALDEREKDLKAREEALAVREKAVKVSANVKQGSKKAVEQLFKKDGAKTVSGESG